MLRAFSAFLLTFWLLGLSVHLGRMVHLLLVGAVVLLAVNLLGGHAARSPRTTKTWERPVL
jgi:hypothetical protein